MNASTEIRLRYFCQRMFAIGQDFWIENDRGQKIFKVDGKAIRIRGTLIFVDLKATFWRWSVPI